jgi:hypothetical protein
MKVDVGDNILKQPTLFSPVNGNSLITIFGLFNVFGVARLYASVNKTE